MKDVLNSNSYSLSKSAVTFKTEDKRLQELFDHAEEKCKVNRRNFAGYDVLIEGEKYTGVWPETQPMGGEMYAKRDIKTALNNILIFMRYQRRDGKIPGMITCAPEWSGVHAYYDWMQGFFFPYPALKMYYLTGKENGYLKQLYNTLYDYDSYLWKYRDSDGDGCLETWCVWDTGEDNYTLHLLNGITAIDNGAYGDTVPPKNAGNMPYESPQYMSYSYACRMVLAEISKILGNGETEEWLLKAKQVKDKFREYLWDEDKKACYLRDNKNERIYNLTQENIKCMYGGIFDQNMADDFIREHLLNEEEFFTPYPIPSIAANDPYFYVNRECSNCGEELEAKGVIERDTEANIDNNSWSGPVNGLTCQRAIDALLNYNHHAEIIMLGEKMIDMLRINKGFVQNYNPFTGAQHGDGDGYGPTMLAFFEYVSLMYGVNVAYEKVLWTGIDSNCDYEYTQEILNRRFTVEHKEGKNFAYIDGKLVFEFSNNVRIKTDLEGNIISIFGICEIPSEMYISVDGIMLKTEIKPNEELAIEDAEIKKVRKVDFKGDA